MSRGDICINKMPEQTLKSGVGGCLSLDLSSAAAWKGSPGRKSEALVLTSRCHCQWKYFHQWFKYFFKSPDPCPWRRNVQLQGPWWQKEFPSHWGQNVTSGRGIVPLPASRTSWQNDAQSFQMEQLSYGMLLYVVAPPVQTAHVTLQMPGFPEASKSDLPDAPSG